MATIVREPTITEPTITFAQLLEERLHSKEEIEKVDVKELVKVDNAFCNWMERTAKKLSISETAVGDLVLDCLGVSRNNDNTWLEKAARRETEEAARRSS